MTVDLGMVREARKALQAIARLHPELIGPSSESNRVGWESTLAEAEESMNGDGQNDAQLVVRLPQAMLDRIDEYASVLREEQPGPSWKRADVVRLLLSRALTLAETKTKKR